MKILISADKHLRETAPVCRTDDYLKTQERKMKFVLELGMKNKALPVDAGDIFDHWKPAPWLISFAMKCMEEGTISTPGNHDLPQHNWELKDRSGYGVLEAAGVLNRNNPIDYRRLHIYCYPWGRTIIPTPNEKSPLTEGLNILVCHALVYQGKPPYPGAEKEGTQASAFLKAHSGFDLIITGHNHQTIVERAGQRILVNPGSMCRMTAAQIDHKPCVFLFDTETRELEQVFIPIEQGVINRDHIEIGEEHDARVSAFVSRLRDDVEIKLSFRDNLHSYMIENDINKAVQDTVWEATEK